MNAGNRIVAQIRREMQDDPRLPPREPSDLERAFRNYEAMQADNDRLREANNDLLVSNRALQAEVNMLREQLAICERERKRAQAVASTFAGGARAVIAVVNDLNELAIKHGIEAMETSEEKKELDEAGAEARAIIERTEPAAPVEEEKTSATLPRATLR